MQSNMSTETGQTTPAFHSQQPSFIDPSADPTQPATRQCDDVDLRVLDRVKRLKTSTFPNRPRKEDHPAPSTIPNVQHLLTSYGITVRYNVIKKKLLVTMPGHSGSPDNFDSVAMTQIISLATLNGMQTGPILGIVEAMGDRDLYNPVADWIRSKPWDGEDRLPAVYATLVQRDDFPITLKETLMYRWLLSAVAAALMPSGFRCRGVLTLQGSQGIGKTAWTKALVSDVALSEDVIKLDHHLDPRNKDTTIGAITHWIVEIGEFDSSLKNDIGALKGLLTAPQDKVRRPYGRTEAEYQRRTVFTATVNDESFLVDPTGNTRFWTIPVVRIDFRHGIDMQQVFAQLAVDFQEGEEWWLTQGEEGLLELHNKDHRIVSAIQDLVREELDLDRKGEVGLPAMSPSQVLIAIGIKEPKNQQARECGSALREALGEPKKINGTWKWRVPLRVHSLSSQQPTASAGWDDDPAY